jgi:16S rRNA (cytidine1402-2'-O)-methyltransferase
MATNAWVVAELGKTNMNKIYVIGTPIGNLKDITLRAVETLKSVDIILAETPRATLKLLNHLEIKKPVFNFFQNPTEKQIKDVLG